MDIKESLRSVLLFLPKGFLHKIVYKKRHNGHKLNLENPITYDDKIQWHMVYTYDKSYAQYADKWLVRDYVKSCGYGDLLIPIVGGPYKSAHEINFDSLPNEFVLKTNHASGSGYYYICKDKQGLNQKMVTEQFDLAMSRDYALHSFEYHYHYIEPLIICEKLLHDSTDRMTDYKVVCSYGRAIAILVCSDRDQGRDYYSTEWEYLPYVKEECRSNTIIEKPNCLDQMLKAAANLSKPFPLARIDFYIAEDKLYFGEITLTPSGGGHKYLSDLGQKELGKQIPTR